MLKAGARRRELPIIAALLALVVGILGLTSGAIGAPSSSESVLKVAPGIDMLDLDGHGKPMQGTDVGLPVMSADGKHIAYQFDVGSGREYGLIWRDLKSGRTVRLLGMAYYPYGLAISASGRYVAYSAKAKAASNGYVTGMSVWLWDTKTDKRTIISRLPDGRVPKDGSTYGVSISANGRWVTFASSSRLLAPVGAIEDPGNTESDGYIYLYDRATGTLTSLPWSSTFPSPTPFGYPVISADGNVIAFQDGLEGPMVWNPSSGLVRSVPLATGNGASDGEGLALSADGSVLASSSFGVSVVGLGESADADRLIWTEQWPESTTGTVALSGDGTELAFLGGAPSRQHAIQRIWTATVPGGPASPLPLAPDRQSLPAAPKPVGGLGRNVVTMTADGSSVATAMCSRGHKSWDQCSSRMDFFRWQTGH